MKLKEYLDNLPEDIKVKILIGSKDPHFGYCTVKEAKELLLDKILDVEVESIDEFPIDSTNIGQGLINRTIIIKNNFYPYHMTLKEFLYSYEDGNLFMIDGEDDTYRIDDNIREAFEDRWNDKIKSFRIEDGYYNDPLFGEREGSYLVLSMVKE